MAALFPTSVKSYTAIPAGNALPFDTVQSFQDEITAVETFLLTGAGSGWTAFTPTWTNGLIGNGSLTGKWLRVNKMMFIDIHLLAGTSTTFGAGGAWTFSLPTAAADTNGQAMSAQILDSGTAFYVGVAAPVSTTTISVYTNGATSPLTNAVPHAWATGDTLRITGFYRLP